MKKLIIIAMMLFATAAFSQQGTLITNIEGSTKYVTVNLTNTGNDTVDYIYVLWPNKYNRWYISETAPTEKLASHYIHQQEHAGDVVMHVEPNSTSGEADSLRFDMLPLVWDPLDEEYATIDDHTRYLVLGTMDTYYQSTRSYLDWTTGQEYICLLTGLVLPVEGIRLEVHLGDKGTCDADITVWFTITQ